VNEARRTIEWYRQRAAEAQALADSMNGESKVTMREIAEQWEAMAVQAELLAEIAAKAALIKKD
jgi:hypothetical protein